MNLSLIRQNLHRYQAARDAARATLQQARQDYAEAVNNAEDAAKAQRLLQEVAATVQQQAHARISTLVGRCLTAVFEEPYTFSVEFEQKRGKTEARLVFTRDGYEVEDVGGGVVDVTSFALRLASLLLSRPPRRRFMVLDEPFGKVKPPEVYGPRICNLLQMLSDEMSIQFIIIPSIEQHYCFGKVVQL